MTRPRGFALLAVLWLSAAFTVLSAASLAQARRTARGAANRVMLLQGRWAAESCAALITSALDSAMRRGSGLIALSQVSRETCHARLVDATDTSVADSGAAAPTRLVLRSTGRGADSLPVSSLELLLVSAGNRSAVIRRTVQ